MLPQKPIVMFDVPEISPPKVYGVEVDGLSWRVDGYRVPLGSVEQTRPLPFSRIGQISLVFNEPVDFGDEQLTLTDSAGNAFELFGPLIAPDSTPGGICFSRRTSESCAVGRKTKQ